MAEKNFTIQKKIHRGRKKAAGRSAIQLEGTWLYELGFEPFDVVEISSQQNGTLEMKVIIKNKDLYN